MIKSVSKLLVSTFITVAVFNTATYGQDESNQKSPWPKIKKTILQEPAIEQKIDSLLSQMSLEQKVGQMIQAEIKSISPDDVAKYHIGSVLNGGGGWPTDRADGPLGAWLSLGNLFYGASMDTNDGRLAIPVMWGTDAVHGHNNVVGATIFPHNIGLGAANNPDLMRDIGTITAREVAITGIDWAFSPTIAVTQDLRWGRSYESFSSDPKIVSTLSREYILGLQGHPALGDFLNEEKIIATAKHFVGDGGTQSGDDQGNTVLSEEDLYKIHGKPYVQAIGVGVQTVMASFSSWNGQKMHGNGYLITDVLKGRMGFDGLVVSDWNAHEQLPGCTVQSCAAIINAGVDLIMVPVDWLAFLRNTIKQVENGEISEARIDDAVRRILRVKMRAGMFESGRPSDHTLAGRATLLGSDEHRSIARQAVRESLVLLKNEKILPIASSNTILVAGTGANNPAMQAGGWTISWQGRGNPKEYYRGFTTVKAGIEAVVSENGGKVVSEFGKGQSLPNAAIVVFGETPYAEFEGDLANLNYTLEGNADYELVKSLKEKGIPVVSVFLTGRPRGVDAVIAESDAFVTAWLPGSEGAGIADVIIGDADGNSRYDFRGKLSFNWPASTAGSEQNDIISVRFPMGYGLNYQATE
ncbi:glycoside hydrolase family 3 protein [Kordiimonas sp. SCSIO 12610]|uniref:glycoside hydrolase family 3 protein n=1 Tax=Kordiimonas sp. SCSIO 12610 TaxID=2829597 RepID=UPI00210BA9F6|nr:glycoside hydrolase family 3 protein [Kordiimonas sp. SCSIO 12610]UTW54704.1 glycoside hydrolase family 3 protein [Kordiimonas sp. SCSIO 12610]